MLDLFWGRGRLDKTRTSLTYLFRLLNFVGIKPPVRLRPLYFIYSALFNIPLFVLIPLAFNLGYILEFKTLTTSQVLTAIQTAINVIAIPPKVLAIVFSLRRFRRAEQLMNQLDERCDSSEDFAKIHETVVQCNRIVVQFVCLYSAYGLSSFISSLSQGLPAFSLYLPFLDWHESRTDFWLQALIEFLFFSIVLSSQMFNDAYPVVYICILRLHLRVLADRIRKLGTQPQQSLDSNYSKLVQCIRDHKLLLDLYETISPVISITIFVQFLITALILGCTMINMFIFASTSVRVACGLYIIAVNVQIYPCCYQATLLEEDSEELTLAIFHCNWLEQDKRFRKMLLFFMHRSQKTMTLTALKLFPINLSTNLSIAKFSFSLYTLLKNMDFGQ